MFTCSVILKVVFCTHVKVIMSRYCENRFIYHVSYDCILPRTMADTSYDKIPAFLNSVTQSESFVGFFQKNVACNSVINAFMVAQPYYLALYTHYSNSLSVNLISMNLPPGISIGTMEDIEAITEISNKAYKGNGQGWTDWAHLQHILQDVPRTNVKDVQTLMEKHPSVFILHTADDGTLNGSLYLEDIGEKKFHLWLMAVDPSKQNQGIGRKLLNGACEHGKQNGYKLVELLTSVRRTEVVAWYERCGFTKTDKIVEFDLSTVLPVPKGSLSEEIEMVKYL